jgi:hypothetical protein
VVEGFGVGHVSSSIVNICVPVLYERTGNSPDFFAFRHGVGQPESIPDHFMGILADNHRHVHIFFSCACLWHPVFQVHLINFASELPLSFETGPPEHFYSRQRRFRTVVLGGGLDGYE